MTILHLAKRYHGFIIRVEKKVNEYVTRKLPRRTYMEMRKSEQRVETNVDKILHSFL